MKTIIYLIQVSACTGIFYLFYQMVLSRLTFFNSNRWYLLGTLMLSFMIPAISLPQNQLTEQLSFSTIGKEYIVYARGGGLPSGNGIDWLIVLPVFYYAVAGILAIYLLISLYSFFKMIRKRSATSLGSIKVYNGSTLFRNSSFFNCIFIDSSGLEEVEVKQVIEHEMIHIEQMHSVDKIIARLLQIVLWFNPFIYAYVNAIDANHEYEVDQIIAQNADREIYANLILRLAESGNSLLGHQFSKFPLSKRITMLFNKPSTNMKKVSYVLILPLVAISCFISACLQTPEQKDSDKVVVNKDVKPISAENADVLPAFPGGVKEWMKYLQNYNYPAPAREHNVSGKVISRFTVETDGSLSDIMIVRDLGYGTGEEAIRLFKHSPKWTPGMKNGRPVRVTYTQPISLSIQ
jgi:hypothetical protein